LEKQRIEEYNDLIENFFNEIDLDTNKISYPNSNSTILKFDRINKIITYENVPLDIEDKYEKITLH